jgi:hypothetical protein
MGWRILVNFIRHPMLKLKTHSGFHDLFLKRILCIIVGVKDQIQNIHRTCYLRNKSWKPECVLSFNMGWRIKFTNIRQPMLKLKHLLVSANPC